MKCVDTDIYLDLQSLVLYGELALALPEKKDFFFEFADVALCALPMSTIRQRLAPPRLRGNIWNYRWACSTCSRLFVGDFLVPVLDAVWL